MSICVKTCVKLKLTHIKKINITPLNCFTSLRWTQPPETVEVK